MKLPRTNKKVIFLDAGGVLFETFVKGNDRIRNLLVERGYSIQKINQAILKAKQINWPFITNWEEEEQHFKKYYGTIAMELGEVEITNELFFLAHYASHCELYPEVKDVLEMLCQDYRLAIISNALPSMDWVFDKLGIRKYFESIILSAFVKQAKPTPEIYKLAMKEMQVKPEECIFIDDKIENIEGAEFVGIKGLHLDRGKMDLIELLSEHQLIKNHIGT